MTKKTIFFALSLLLFIGFTSCKKEDNNNNTPPVSTTTTTDISITVRDYFGAPIANASIEFRGSTVLTNATGTAFLNDVSAKLGNNTLIITADGYYSKNEVLHIESNNKYSLDTKMISHSGTDNFTSSIGSTINLAGGGSVVFSPNTIADASGTMYSGSVEVLSKYLNPTGATIKYTAPNTYQGKNSAGQDVFLENIGMIQVELSDGSGNPLNIINGGTAEVHIPVASPVLGSAPASIPLYYFDTDQGIWIEDGIANLVGSEYVGTVTHFSFWMCPFIYDHHSLSGNLECSGNYLPGVKVRMYSSWGSYLGSVNTNMFGGFYGSIADGPTFTMEVDDPCGNAVYSNTIGPFSSNTNLGAIEVCIGTSANFGVLQGNLLDCNSNPESNAYLRIVSGGLLRFLPTSSTGNFNSAVLFCTGETEAFISGLNGSNLDVSPETLMTIAPVMNFGDLIVCGQASEFATFNLNGTNYYFTPNTQIIFDGNVNMSSANLNELRVSDNSTQFIEFSIRGFDANQSFQYLGGSPLNYSFHVTAGDGTVDIPIYFSYVGTSVGDFVEGTIGDTIYNGNTLTNVSFRFEIDNFTP